MTKTLDEIGRLFGEGAVAGLSDDQLLERFASKGDGRAFEAIVARHGPLVLSACRSALGPRDRAEDEDAFQATFLILARRAGTFPLHGNLAGWLYRVARRAGRQASLGASRRRAREQAVAGRGRGQGRGPSEPPHDPALGEVRDLVQEEIARLPEQYRAPILLCDLHGLTRDEAARAIGCPPGTVAGRLARAREMLKGRLARRGITEPTAPLLAVVAPPALFRSAARMAIASAQGDVVASAAARLAARASGGWFGARVPGGLAALASSAVAVVVIALGAAGKPVDPPPPPPPTRVIPPAAQVDEPIPVDPDDPALVDIFAGKVVDAAGKPVARASVYLVRVTDERWVLPDAGAVRAVTGADGRFRFSAKDMTFTSLDGLPARRPGLLIADADGLGADCVPTWGQQPPVYPPHQADKKVADWTLTLPPDEPIRGRLLGPEGRPLAGAIVRLEGLVLPWKGEAVAELAKLESPTSAFDHMGNRHPQGQGAMILNRGREFVADVDGRFRIAGLGRDRLAQLIIRGPGVSETRASVVTRDMPEIRRPRPDGPVDVTFGADFTVTLERGQILKGVVRDRATSQPLPGVRVGLTDPSITGLPVVSDARGRFAIDGVRPLAPRDVLDVYATPEPGRPYLPGKVRLLAPGEAVIDCPAGIPFRLMLRDEAGRPVEAEVAYSALHPNEAFNRLFWSKNFGGPVLTKAARQADGSYLGVALPGPGVVTAKLPPGVPYRPAFVDPKAFFAPGKKDWTRQDEISTYGNLDTLPPLTGGGPWTAMQEDYAALVLINPPEGSKPLELSATVMPPRPRMVTLVDSEGRPVVGATPRGITFYYADHEPKLRTSTFPLTKLHPDRSRRITFFEEDRKLIGFLMARGDGDSPYLVRMRPWATVTGRFVDERGGPVVFDGPGGGNPGPVYLGSDHGSLTVAIDDPKVGDFPDGRVEVDGRFRVERLVPGQVYSASYYVGMGGPHAKLLDRAIFAPGEVRDLGNIRAPIKPKPKAEAEAEAEDKPAAEPVPKP
jgi:RNA polymerase sigma factor (sigma-70 family)